MNKEIVLGACGYFVEVDKKCATFTESRPVACTTITQFTLERSKGLNDSPGTWRFTRFNFGTCGISPLHLEEATEYCCTHFGENFTPYKGEMSDDAKDKPTPTTLNELLGCFVYLKVDGGSVEKVLLKAWEDTGYTDSIYTFEIEKANGVRVLVPWVYLDPTLTRKITAQNPFETQNDT